MNRWITDTPLSKRFSLYTRANADEVGPDPFSPLGWSLVWQQGCIPGVAQGFVDFGVCDYSEYDLDPPQMFANFHSKSPINFSGYNNAEVDRLLLVGRTSLDEIASPLKSTMRFVALSLPRRGYIVCIDGGLVGPRADGSDVRLHDLL